MNKYTFDSWLHVEALTKEEAKDIADQHYAANGYPRSWEIGYWEEVAPNRFVWVS